MPYGVRHFVPLLIAALWLTAGAQSALGRAPEPINKLLYMYRFYYLPFSVSFEEGRSPNDVLPFLPERYPEPGRLLTAEELTTLDGEWNQLKESWAKRSLLENTKVPLNETVRISQRLISHRVSLSRGALDRISIGDRIQLNEAMKSKPPDVRAAFIQIRFLKSFLAPLDLEKFNFFIVSASWCSSSREYRILLESYLKQFPSNKINLHSVVVEDPQEQIFESKMLQELFPNPKRYSHNSIPRFVAIEVVNGKTRVYEEGEALKELYERHLAKQRGFLDPKTTLFRQLASPATPAKVDPFLSSVVK